MRTAQTLRDLEKMLVKDFSKCKAYQGCRICGDCFSRCDAGDTKCLDNCVDVCPNGALYLESVCCKARLIGGVQCEACGADGREYKNESVDNK